jgi:hypothetical protein
MERDYFKETLPEHRTPKAHTGIMRTEQADLLISLWLCSNDNSMNQDQWFFAVKVDYCNKEDHTQIFQSEVHFYLDEREAWVYRAKQMGSDTVHFTDYQRFLLPDNRIGERGELTAQDFRGCPLWDGYLLQEIRNLKS